MADGNSLKPPPHDRLRRCRLLRFGGGAGGATLFLPLRLEVDTELMRSIVFASWMYLDLPQERVPLGSVGERCNGAVEVLWGSHHAGLVETWMSTYQKNNSATYFGTYHSASHRRPLEDETFSPPFALYRTESYERERRDVDAL